MDVDVVEHRSGAASGYYYLKGLDPDRVPDERDRFRMGEGGRYVVAVFEDEVLDTSFESSVVVKEGTGHHLPDCGSRAFFKVVGVGSEIEVR